MSTRRWLLLLLAAALAARVLFCVLFPQGLPDGGVPNLDMYHHLAGTLLQDGTLRDLEGRLTAMREPGYPLVLAGLYAVSGPRYRAVLALHCLLGVLTVWLVWLLGLRLFGPRCAWLAALMAAFHPQLLYYTALPRRETFQAFLLAWSVWLLLDALDFKDLWPLQRPGAPKGRRGWRTAGAPRWLLAGAIWALNPLTNSAFLPAGLAAAAAAVLVGRSRSLDLRRGAGLFLAAYVALFALWPLRNASVFHRFIPGINGGGNHIYIGFIVPDDAAGTPGEQAYLRADATAQAAVKLSEEDKDALFYRAALDWIRAHPAGFAKRLGGSFLKLWRLYPYPRDYGTSYRLIQWASLLSDGWILPLALIGLLLGCARRPACWVPASVLGAVTFTYMVFWAVIRYRVPLMPLVFPFAACALERVGSALRLWTQEDA
ncbi:MAG: glycosyltransferase family 39 protein [Elusimicrobiota bacterium]|jgi:4-amino-4-deoxy-L-arabinose transferase-like glycosyltransferase